MVCGEACWMEESERLSVTLEKQRRAVGLSHTEVGCEKEQSVSIDNTLPR